MLGVASPLVAGTHFDRSRIEESIEKGHLDATTLMEALIVEGVPQRTAHETVGKLVRLALTKGVAWLILLMMPVRQNMTAGMPLSGRLWVLTGS